MSCGIPCPAGYCNAVSQENVELVRKLWERWELGDFATPEALDPQIEYVRIGGAGVAGAGEWSGLDGVWDAFRELFQEFRGFRTEGERFIDLGDDRVLVLSRIRGVGRSSGVAAEQETADVITLRNGVIVRAEAYWNRAEACQAVGLVE